MKSLGPLLPRRLFLAGALSALAPLPQAARAQGADYDCIIIGAGVSGLVAAYLLKHRNILVIEKEKTVGGRVVNYGGLPVGAQYTGRPEGLLNRLVNRLNLPLVEVPQPADLLLRKDGFYHRLEVLVKKGGVEAFNRLLLTLLEISKAYQAPPSYDQNGPLARLDAMTCEAWFKELALPKIYFDIYTVTVRGRFGVGLGQISALGAFEELAFDFAELRPLKSVEDLPAQTASGVFTLSSGLSSGLSGLTDGLAKDLGPRVRLDEDVVSITKEEDEPYVVNGSFSAQTVILAVPTPIIKRLAPLTDEQHLLLSRQRTRSYATLAVKTDQPLFKNGFNVVVPDGLSFTNIYNPGWLRGSPATDVVFYMPPHAAMGLNEDAMLTRVLRDFEKLIPGWNGAILDSHVTRFPYAFPVMGLGSFNRLLKLHQSLDGGLQLAGDGMVYPNIEGAVEAGRIAALRVQAMLNG